MSYERMQKIQSQREVQNSIAQVAKHVGENKAAISENQEHEESDGDAKEDAPVQKSEQIMENNNDSIKLEIAPKVDQEE